VIGVVFQLPSYRACIFMKARTSTYVGALGWTWQSAGREPHDTDRGAVQSSMFKGFKDKFSRSGCPKFQPFNCHHPFHHSTPYISPFQGELSCFDNSQDVKIRHRQRFLRLLRRFGLLETSLREDQVFTMLGAEGKTFLRRHAPGIALGFENEPGPISLP
jgi:hypothetical protein